MQLDIQGIHYDVTDVTRDFITAKLEKIRYAEDLIVDLLFTLSKQTKDWKSDVKVNFRWGVSIHMEETAYNLHEALEKLIDRLDVKVSKEKEKIKNHHSHDSHKPEPIDT